MEHSVVILQEMLCLKDFLLCQLFTGMQSFAILEEERLTPSILHMVSLVLEFTLFHFKMITEN